MKTTPPTKQNINKSSFLQKLKDLFIMFAIFFKIGLFSFGGGYAMLTLIENEVVTKRGWLTHSELGNVFAIAESTPGAIAINIATFIGTKQHGIFGGIFATLGVVLPSFTIIVGLSYILNLVRDNVWVSYLFKGIRVGVLVLIAKAVISFYKDMRKNIFSFVLMIAAFLLVFLTDVSVVYIILGAIVISSVGVAAISLRNSKLYHMCGTSEYYNERVGKPLEKDEFFNQTAVDKGILTIKTPDCDICEPNENCETNLDIPQNDDGNASVKGDINSQTKPTDDTQILLKNKECDADAILQNGDSMPLENTRNEEDSEL